MVTGVVPSSPRFLAFIFFIAHRVQQFRCSSIFHRALLIHALALSASQSVHNKKSLRIYASVHSGGLELTKLTYTRLEDNLIRHRGDRITMHACLSGVSNTASHLNATWTQVLLIILLLCCALYPSCQHEQSCFFAGSPTIEKLSHIGITASYSKSREVHPAQPYLS